MKSIAAALLLILSSAAAAQEPPAACPAFEGAIGPEFVFKDPVRYSSYVKDAENSPHFPKGDLPGKRVRFTGAESDDYEQFFTAVTEDCVKLRLKALSIGPLSRLDASFHNFDFVGPDIDSKIALIKPGTNWRTVEKVDPMTDEKSCYVTAGGYRAKLNPMFVYHSREAFAVTAAGADFPGKPLTYRIDKNAAVRGGDVITGARAQGLVDQARKGSKLLVAGYTWPYEVENVAEYELAGIVPKLEHCRAFVKR
jgi:hypothetical protein